MTKWLIINRTHTKLDKIGNIGAGCVKIIVKAYKIFITQFEARRDHGDAAENIVGTLRGEGQDRHPAASDAASQSCRSAVSGK